VAQSTGGLSRTNGTVERSQTIASFGQGQKTSWSCEISFSTGGYRPCAGISNQRALHDTAAGSKPGSDLRNLYHAIKRQRNNRCLKQCGPDVADTTPRPVLDRLNGDPIPHLRQSRNRPTPRIAGQCRATAPVVARLLESQHADAGSAPPAGQPGSTVTNDRFEIPADECRPWASGPRGSAVKKHEASSTYVYA
jgi:hypothetical protein